MYISKIQLSLLYLASCSFFFMLTRKSFFRNVYLDSMLTMFHWLITIDSGYKLAKLLVSVI